MIGVIDEQVYALYVDALSSSFSRRGHSTFVSKKSAEKLIRTKISNNGKTWLSPSSISL